MENSFTIRKAQLKDLDILNDFMQGIVDTERPFNPTLQAGEIEYYDIRKMILDDDYEVLVVLDGQRLISAGYGQIKALEAYEIPQIHLFLGFMYVLPKYRGQGVNKMLIDELFVWGKKRGMTECRLQVYSENAGAVRAYEKLGFSHLLTTMRMILK